MDITNKNRKITVTILAIGIVVIYLLSVSVAYNSGIKVGYKRAQADQKKLDEAAAMKATEDAINAANPFQFQNPLEGVETNPLEKTQKVLNPFK